MLPTVRHDKVESRCHRIPRKVGLSRKLWLLMKASTPSPYFSTAINTLWFVGDLDVRRQYLQQILQISTVAVLGCIANLVSPVDGLDVLLNGHGMLFRCCKSMLLSSGFSHRTGRLKYSTASRR